MIQLAEIKAPMSSDVHIYRGNFPIFGQTEKSWHNTKPLICGAEEYADNCVLHLPTTYRSHAVIVK